MDQQPKFKLGDKVKETKGFGNIGVVTEIQKDDSWKGGYSYLIDFGTKGNQLTCGESFELIK